MEGYKFGELPERERQVFGCISMNLDRGHEQEVLDSLLTKGLIQRFDEYGIRGYRVPLPIHMAWCAWCAENADLDEGT